MLERRSIEVDGLPIPTASRVGPFIATGGIRGVDTATGQLSEDLATQVRLTFVNLQRVIEASGGRCDTILKVDIWISRPEARSMINDAWVALFPNPISRPARHIINYNLPGGMFVQCAAMAIAE
jgi:2-iminobutanoate/2-iminopropanoate deaminase